MIRVMTSDGPALTTITVDGQLSGEYVEVVERSCDAARSKGKPISLFLRDVTVIGEDGKALLRRLAAKGVRLKSSGVYNSYIVQSIQPDDLPATPLPKAMPTRRLETGFNKEADRRRHSAGPSGFDTCPDTSSTCDGGALPPGLVTEVRSHCAR